MVHCAAYQKNVYVLVYAVAAYAKIRSDVGWIGPHSLFVYEPWNILPRHQRNDDISREQLLHGLINLAV